MQSSMLIDQVQGFIFDLDGTVYLGEQALPGAVETIAWLRQMGKGVLFVSNKPLEPRRAYADKLTRLGIPTVEADVITSAAVLGSYLARRCPGLQVYVVGEENLKNELRQYGVWVLPELEDQDARQVIAARAIDVVVVAFDRTLDYRKLNTAYQALQCGAHFVATNGDRTCPMPGGAIPDAGATLAYLETLTGRQVEVVAGKPSPLILQAALERLALPAQACMLTGDRLETDIRMGREAGMLTALVLTGATCRAQLAHSPDRPDLVLEAIGELRAVLYRKRPACESSAAGACTG